MDKTIIEYLKIPEYLPYYYIIYTPSLWVPCRCLPFLIYTNSFSLKGLFMVSKDNIEYKTTNCIRTNIQQYCINSNKTIILWLKEIPLFYGQIEFSTSLQNSLLIRLVFN